MGAIPILDLFHNFDLFWERLMQDAEKARRYGEVAKQISAVLEGESNEVTRMATVSCLLSQAFDYYFWTGFYMVDPEKPHELVVGPYQGTLGCLRIPFGKGVCGVAAQSRETQLVADVNAFPSHIACDSRSQSEIVVPVTRPDGTLMAVFDVDSTALNSFNEVDKQWLEQILNDVFGKEPA
ncbi:hypothetical protein GCM10007972_05350 [Iodidimonas muriae]|uniref:GAF domain-containing protein n=2 Tax=Iodidimonas muriae TaxID=261467 RepID=A0ABQ2L8D7_9PROT|nr:hypothetical protein JCM17843_00710 [Kordiimonadales bacterium JCM 17843]GGO06778.1 hypothetical protein GCM10007972_05350 [Iodidimonas muriae]